MKDNILEFDKIIGICVDRYDVIKLQLQKCIGVVDNKEVCICIYPNEGKQVPHFHIHISSFLNTDSDCCIKIKENKYFIHGRHVKTLNSKELKLLNTFLNERCKDYNGNNWQYIINSWNKLNNDNIDINSAIPDYNNIVEE